MALKLRRRLAGLAWALSFAPAGLVAAQPGPPAAAAGDRAVQQVVVQGPGLDAQARLGTAAMTVVGREELDAQGDTSVLDVLQRLPGITIDGETPRLRGLGEGYTLVLINGEPAPPGFTLESLAPADIERIEIIKGPSAKYGGTAGTINVILRSSPRSRQREARATAGWRAVRPQGQMSLSWGDREAGLGWQLPATVSRSATETGSRSLRDSRTPAGEVTRQSQTGTDRSLGQGLSFAPRIDWMLSTTDTLQLQGFAQRNETDNSGQRQTAALSGPAPYSANDAWASQIVQEQARVQGQWVRKWPSGHRLELKASAQTSLWQQASRTQAVSATGLLRPLREGLASQRDGSRLAGARWRLPWTLGRQGHALSLGADLEERERRDLRRQFDDGVESLAGSLGRSSQAHTTRGLVFAQNDWDPAPGWSVALGLRATLSQLHSRGPQGQSSSRSAALLPIFNLRHALDPKGRQVFRASLAGSERLPDAGLLMPRYVLNGSYDRATSNTPIAADVAGNPALKPERSINLDLAYEAQLAGGGVVGASVFLRHIDGLIRRRIALESVPEASVPRWVSRPVNLGRARSSGLELEWKGRPLPGLGLRGALSLYRSSVAQIDDPDARLEGQAPWSSSLGLDYNWPGTRLSAGASLVLTPGFAVQQSDLQRQTRSASRRLDAYLLWRASRELQWRLAVLNALARDAANDSRITDIDGFGAGAQTWRQTLPTFNAGLVWRF